MASLTIRRNLVDAINEISGLIEVCPDPNQKFELRIKVRELFQRLDRVIVANLDTKTEEFKEAILALKELTKMARKAKKKLDNVAGIINKATDVVAKVEKLVKNVVGLVIV
ncbi:MAG: hypothetical protein L3J00_04785 [Thiomicrorhabdus sp.]|nr:hypothetical protein [Thiomicrorhabdus sp.]